MNIEDQIKYMEKDVRHYKIQNMKLHGYYSDEYRACKAILKTLKQYKRDKEGDDIVDRIIKHGKYQQDKQGD